MSVDIDTPLLSKEETEALFEAVQQGELRGGADAEPIQLGSVERFLQDAAPAVEKLMLPLRERLRRSLVRFAAGRVSVEPMTVRVELRQALLHGDSVGSVAVLFRCAGGGANLLAIGRNLADFMMQRALGATGSMVDLGVGDVDAPRKTLTAVDCRVLRPFANSLVRLCAETIGVSEGDMQLERIVDNPQQLEEVAAMEPLLCLSLGLRLGDDLESQVRVGLGVATVRRMLAAIAPKRGVAGVATVQRTEVEHRLGDSQVTLVARLGDVQLTVRELLRLGRGSLLRLDSSRQSPIEICISDLPFFVGQPTRRNGNLAVQIANVCQGKKP